ncbi:4Fe-4S double cluster binding domain-containing protein [Methanosphaera sp. WGK6]|uniref:4Fe-4S double cluster binding domain-containing protein n=1 Tax=Methanosphaera sp. WGK6 TaxID=1561964 RepID=UPI00084CE2ED|nr:4Fe-4S double cluster binding domain-containing protein [Methanosphaera sp. WGK6]OED30352.1 hypothetical protein NL43_02955 [Methanosphaera sp. WGK6]
MNLWDKIQDICKKETTIYGIANMNSAKEYLNKEYPSLKTYPYAISIGINIPDKIVDNIENKYGEIDYLNTYNKTNKKLDKIGQRIEQTIQKNGYKAKQIPASDIVSKEKLIGDMSHKLVANLAGLGWIGKSCLLINPYYGPRIRWATILTNAQLQYNKKILSNKCNTCRLCVVNCPAKAIKNVNFKKEDPRSVRYDAYACNNHFKKLESEGRPKLCGLCVKVCPWGLVNKKSRN